MLTWRHCYASTAATDSENSATRLRSDVAQMLFPGTIAETARRSLSGRNNA
jgi:hypothetical protein